MKKVVEMPFWLATVLLVFASLGTLRAQSNYATPYTFTTLAGSAGPGSISQSADGTGSEARFSFPMGVAVDGAGNVYVADMDNNSVRKITPVGVVTTLANLPALPDLYFSRPQGVAVDGVGNVYVAEGLNNRIRKITPTGVVTTVAGNSTPNPDLPRLSGPFGGTIPDPSNQGYTDGPASTARFKDPQGVAVDSSGNIFVADAGNRRIRKITPGGTVTTLAGTSPFRPANVDGTGTAAWFGAPGDIAVDAADNLYVTDYGMHTIRKVTQTGVVTTIAGKTDTPGSADGPASEARFNHPGAVAVDSSGNIYVADQDNRTIRMITPAGLVTTLAGLAGSSGNVDGTGPAARFASPSGVAVDGAGNLYVADQGTQTIRKGTLGIPGPAVAPAITSQPASLTVTSGSSVTFTATASGSPAPLYQWQNGGANISGATSVSLTIANVAAGDAGTYAVVATNTEGSASSNAATLTVLPGRLINQTVTTGHGMTFSAANASGSIQWQLSFDGLTWINLANSAPYSGATTSLLSITSAGPALNGLKYRFVATDNGSVASSPAVTLTVAPALLPFPTSVAVHSAGYLLVGDANANTIQRIFPVGTIFLVAGNSGTSGSTDGTGADARFNQPNGLTLLANGTLIASDTSNAIIRSITGSGVVTTLAGSPGSRGNADGAGRAATFSSPIGIAHDAAGVLYVADSMNHTIRKITPDGTVTTLAGSAGVSGFADGTGGAARFNFPSGIAVDGGGNIWVADTTNNLIRRITSAGVVTTVAGVQNVAGFDDGTGGGALFNHPGGLAADAAGNVFVADTDNSTIRRITPTGVVTTIAGLPTIAGLEDGSGPFALFNHPLSLSVDASGNIFVADTGNATIRKIDTNRNVTTVLLTAQVIPTPTPTSTDLDLDLDPTPTSTSTPTSAPSSSGGGGGGGAPSFWFFAALSLLSLGRRLYRPRH